MTSTKTISATSPQTSSTSLPARQAAASSKETLTRLKHLPPGIKFGDEPISYDETRGVLVYRGFMFHASYIYLHKLSADPEYQTAIDQLFLGSAQEQSGRKYGVVVKAAVSLAVAAAAVGVWACFR